MNLDNNNGAIDLWPVKTGFVNLKPEADRDEHDELRMSPIGSTWEVIQVDRKAGTWTLLCKETGGWIFPDEATIHKNFIELLTF
jgi:hypothetical protein